MTELTVVEQREIVTAADKWRSEPFDEHVGVLFAVVEAITTARTADLRAQLAATEAKLAAARLALAACRDVREARDA